MEVSSKESSPITKPCEVDGFYDFYKDSKDEKIWSTRKYGEIGPIYFSFDCKKIYNFWTDYPDKLSKEEKEIFDKERPDLARLKNKARQ